MTYVLKTVTSTREVPGTNFDRGTDYSEFRAGYRLFPISAGVPTVPNFGRGNDFRISGGVLTVPNFGRGTDCSEFRPR